LSCNEVRRAPASAVPGERDANGEMAVAGKHEGMTMADLFREIFASFWTWLGTLILLSVAMQSITLMILSILGINAMKKEESEK